MPSVTVKVPVELEVEIEWGTVRSGSFPFISLLHDFRVVDFVATGQKVMTPKPGLEQQILASSEVADAICNYEQPEPAFGKGTKDDRE
jgi:hypothetical protein